MTGPGPLVRLGESMPPTVRHYMDLLPDVGHGVVSTELSESCDTGLTASHLGTWHDVRSITFPNSCLPLEYRDYRTHSAECSAGFLQFLIPDPCTVHLSTILGPSSTQSVSFGMV